MNFLLNSKLCKRKENLILNYFSLISSFDTMEFLITFLRKTESKFYDKSKGHLFKRTREIITEVYLTRNIREQKPEDMTTKSEQQQH